MEPANIRVAHHVPGRTRLRVAKVKGDERAGKIFQDLGRSIPGVYDVRTNCVTGSVLFQYRKHDPEVRERLGAALREADRLLSIAVPEIGDIQRGIEILKPEEEFIESRLPLVRSIVSALKDSDRKIRQATGGAIDLGTLLPLALGLGLLLADEKSKLVVLGVLGLVSLHAFAALRTSASDDARYP